MRVGSAQDGIAIARVFGAARADMRYLPNLHSRAAELLFFVEQVLPTSRVTVAEIDGVIVGFSAVRAGWLDHLYVNPGQQGCGIGGSLLRLAMTEHPEGLSLWAFEPNHRAIAFYARAGFAEVLRTDGGANEERVPDVQMRWTGAGAAV